MRLLPLLAALVASCALALPAWAGGAGTTLVISPQGAGAGTVTGPYGISCHSNGLTTSQGGAACSFTLTTPGIVVLTATADPGSVLDHWAECPSTTATTCTFTVANPPGGGYQKAETFFEPQHQLTIAVGGSGAGTVTSTPAGISCPGACTTTTVGILNVVLVATPSAGSVFTGWSGDCAAFGQGTCSVTMTQNRSATATFAPYQSFALSVTAAGSGSGATTSSPAGILCPSTCSSQFASGSVVTLTPSAAAGSTFTGWSGACTGTGGCTVTVTQALSVTATYEPTPVHASLVETELRVTKKRGRVARVRISADERVDVTIRIVRKKRTLASLSLAGFGPGGRTLPVPIGKGVAAGKAQLVVTFAGPAGTTKTQMAALKLPAP